jgi:hypothetical protein
LASGGSNSGVIQCLNSTVNFIGAINFTSNSADYFSSGGAIFNNNNGTIIFNNSRVIFSGNKAGAVLNDIYNKGTININNGSYVEFNSGITGNGIINISDNSKVLLGGNINYQGDFYVNDGIVSITTNSIAIKNLSIGQNALYTSDTQHITYSESVSIAGEVNFNLDLTSGESDKIIVTGTTALTDTSKWSITTTGSIREDKIFTILESNLITGTFSNNKLNILNMEYTLQYYDNRIDVLAHYVITLFGKSKTTQNKADFFNEIHSDNQRSLPSGINQLITDLFLLRDTNDIPTLEHALEKLSGTFYADIFMSATNNKNSVVLFNRLHSNLLTLETHQSFWTQFLHYSKTLPSDEAYLGDFKNTNTGVLFGTDIVQTKRFIFGLFGQYQSKTFAQDKNSADGNNYGFGIYTLNELDSATNISLKTTLSYEKESLSASRDFEINGTTYNPKSEIEFSAIKAAVGVEKSLTVNDKISITPFFGIQGGMVFHSGVDENNGAAANLSIDNGTSSRLYGAFGINADFNPSSILTLRMGLSGRTVLVGEKGKITEIFIEEGNYEMETESTKEVAFYDADLQLDYKIGKNFTINLNTSYGFSKASEYFVGLGFSFRLLPAKSTEEYEF